MLKTQIRSYNSQSKKQENRATRDESAHAFAAGIKQAKKTKQATQHQIS
jgi:hypothetical protein